MLLGYRRLERRQDTKFSWRQYLERECIYITIFRRRFISILVHTQKQNTPNFSSWLHSIWRGTVPSELLFNSIKVLWLLLGAVHKMFQVGGTTADSCFSFLFMCTIFKVLIEFDTILLLFYVLVSWPWGMWDLSCTTRDWTHTHCIGRQSLTHWTTRKVPTPVSKDLNSHL